MVCITVILRFKLDLFPIHSICQPDVNTKKAKPKIKKPFPVQELQALNPAHKANTLKKYKITT